MEFQPEQFEGGLFIGDIGTKDHIAFFEEMMNDDDAPRGGYLYVSDRHKQVIVRDLEIYSAPLGLFEDDVRIFWSSDASKCGVSIWGRMRGVIDLRNGEISVNLRSPQGPAVTDSLWLEGFDTYLDQADFLTARGRFWRHVLREHEPDFPMSREEEVPPITTKFVVYEKGNDSLFGVFEDEGSTGYLYVYDLIQRKIIRHLHNYDRSELLSVNRSDVTVIWSNDKNKCAVKIWGQFRGIIDLNGREGRVWMEHPDSPGIDDAVWLGGF